MRAFLAIELPDPWRVALHSFVQESSSKLHGWRWVTSDLHVTVRFLGEVDPALIARASLAWRRELADRSRPTLILTGPGVFPSKGTPRVLWIGVTEAGRERRLEAIFRSVEEVCVSEGLAAERRRFHPHVTLARARREGRPATPSDTFALGEGPFVPDALTLFRSQLGPQGARYVPIDRFPFGVEG
jgi:2'-5' RNA ligase